MKGKIKNLKKESHKEEINRMQFFKVSGNPLTRHTPIEKSPE